MPRVFVSDAVDAERLAFGAGRPPAGGAWKTLSSLYQASLAAYGHTVQPLIRPEIYQSEAARHMIGVAAGDWHLAVKPTEHLRPFHGMANVFRLQLAIRGTLPRVAGSVAVLRSGPAARQCRRGDLLHRSHHADASARRYHAGNDAAAACSGGADPPGAAMDPAGSIGSRQRVRAWCKRSRASCRHGRCGPS